MERHWNRPQATVVANFEIASPHTNASLGSYTDCQRVDNGAVTLIIAVLIYNRSWRDSFEGYCRSWNGDAKLTIQEESLLYSRKRK